MYINKKITVNLYYYITSSKQLNTPFIIFTNIPSVFPLRINNIPILTNTQTTVYSSALPKQGGSTFTVFVRGTSSLILNSISVISTKKLWNQYDHQHQKISRQFTNNFPRMNLRMFRPPRMNVL